MTNATILVVDDEELIRWSLREGLKAEGYDILEAGTGREALEQFKHGVDLVLLDYRLPDIDGLSVLRELKKHDPDVLVILLTSLVNVDIAVEAMKLGAFHFANKPFNVDEVAATVARALETTRLRREVKQLRENEARPYTLRAIVGESQQIDALRQMVAKVAGSPASTVLLMGESGTGKDLVAKTIHYSSGRAARPFMNITCSALPEQLLESELFGHERGAFTDARMQKRGLLESADGGTVFLDEIGEMVPALQAKLLRFLEEKSFKRVGGAADIRVDVRVVAATNRNLDEQVAKGAFRSDLYYRLNVLPIHLPPLREHAEDVPVLVTFFIDQFNREFKKRISGVSPAADVMLRSYGWPGNVRELRNVVERAMLLGEGDRLEAKDFGALKTGLNAGDDPFELPAAGVHLDDLERSLVVQALRRAGGNQTKAAALLGLNRDQIRYRIEKFGLTATH
ncbi:MAG TPA: sigma-54 dependent transcriptional regulator [Vicinamibacterales bacterium]|jgi:DNA-binding NtrC family response regulator|nr:sigma-54 dependent transcriptional regulator [Vicinamibacterales bacterium]